MRSDGTLVKNADPMHTVMASLLNRRCDSTVMVTLNIPLDPIRSYTRQKRREGRAVSHLAVIVGALLRIIREYPQFNRFIVNSRLYQHNDFSISMMVLRPGGDATIPKIHFDLNDGIFEVSRRIEEQISVNREARNENKVDNAIKKLLALPGFMPFGGWMLRFLDKHGMLPKWLIEASPFHASMAITNMASLNTPHVYHHLYEVGTISAFMALGTEQFPPMRTRDEIVATRCIPITLTIDERICSGAYFALMFARFRHYLANPALLEDAPDEVKKPC